MMRSMTSQHKIAFIIPAFNEAKTIKEVVLSLHKEAKRNRLSDYEIVVVDDGSSDSTASEAMKAKAYVIKHILNSGSGAATATGLSYAEQNGFTIAATLDADGQHDPADVLNGIKRMEKDGDTSLLIGSRLIDSKGMSKVKVLGNKGLSIITNILFGVKVTDSQSGLRIFSRSALEKLRWKTSGYEFCSEMLWRAKQQNLSVSEFPIRAIYTEYSISKGQNNWNAFNIIKSLIRRRIMELISE